MEELRVALLGSPRITRGERPLIFKRRKAVALLAYLVLTGRPHARETLATLLAGELAEEQAKKQLRNVLSNLAEQLGDYLLITRQTVAFNRELPYWVDVLALQRAVEVAQQAHDTALLPQAVALYADEVLAGFNVRDAAPFEEWLLREREHTATLLRTGLDLLLAQYLQCDDHDAALEAARRLLALEPWREDVHRTIMAVLLLRGQRSAALAQYETCRHILATELGSAPEPATTALYERLRCGANAVVVPHNLPDHQAASAADFVGREEELAELARRLDDPTCRLVTILGLGGSGKTHLALHAAARYVGGPALHDPLFPDGIYRVSLARPVRPACVSAAAATRVGAALLAAMSEALGPDALAASGSSADPLTTLVATLQSRQTLLILENGEHLLAHDGAGLRLLATVLRRAPRLKLLVTSRVRLRLPEEWVLELGPLTVPSGPDELERAAASRLFLQQAQQVQAHLDLTPAERRHVVELCRLTQGLPLAVILAARWLRGLSCAAVVEQLAGAGGLALLAMTEQMRPERHASLLTVLDDTWQSLSDEEQGVLGGLGVFVGGFSSEAAHAVTGATPAHLLALRDRVILQYDGHRYTFPTLIGRYVAAQADARPDAMPGQARHAAYFAAFVQTHAGEAGARETIGVEYDNVCRAWEWALSQLDAALLLRMQPGLAAWFVLAARPDDGVAVFGQAIQQLQAALATAAGSPLCRLLGDLLVDRAALLGLMGRHDEAQEHLNDAHALARGAGMLELEARIALQRARQMQQQGHLNVAQEQAEQALALARTTGRRDLEGDALDLLGLVALATSAYAQAHAYVGQALPLFQALNDRRGAAWAALHQGRLLHEQGNMAGARDHAAHALAAFQMLDDRHGEMSALRALGRIYDEGEGHHADAERCFRQSLDLAEALGVRRAAGRAQAGLGRNALYRGDLRQAASALGAALEHARAIGDDVGAGVALRGLGLLAHDQGDGFQACELARQALHSAQETGHLRGRHAALRLLGHALLQGGDPTRAALTYHEALALDVRLDTGTRAVEVRADLTRVAMARGEAEQVARHVMPLLAALEAGLPAGIEDPAALYLTAYQVLDLWHDARATGVLAAGYRLLQERSGRLAVEQQQQFFAHVPSHGALARAWAACRLSAVADAADVGDPVLQTA